MVTRGTDQLPHPLRQQLRQQVLMNSRVHLTGCLTDHQLLTSMSDTTAPASSQL
jgi:hypothetical protein